MTAVAWIGNELGIQKQARPMEGLFYVIPEDNFERCFSKYGFAYPMKTHELDYAALIENRLPQLPAGFEDAVSQTNWMLIDHHGEVWQVDYFVEFHKGTNIRKISYWSVPGGKVATLALADEDPDAHLLAGFLKVCQDKQKVSDFVVDKKIGGGKPLHWFSKDTIVARLKKEFPRE